MKTVKRGLAGSSTKIHKRECTIMVRWSSILVRKGVLIHRVLSDCWTLLSR